MEATSRNAARVADFGPGLAEASVLVVDDEPGMRGFLMRALRQRCAEVAEAADCAEASRLLDTRRFDVVILDNLMPGQSGVDWLTEQRGIGFFSDAILMTAHADLDTAIQAIRAGASDFITKPFRVNQILSAVACCLDRARLRRENLVMRHELRASGDRLALRDRLIGGSEAIRAVRAAIERVAPLPSSVLLTGASGTGKEVAARMIHALSPRAQKLFVPVNCAAISPSVIESELFGHLRGAFTGAETAREGLFLHARGGTLFLDEISELPASAQSKLLRVLEDRRVRPVGSEREVPVDLRFVFATNADLERDVAEGRFRADLFFRINVMRLHLPPLRERGEDVLALADLFMEKLARQLGMPPVPLDAAARAALTRYGWPGNVRELRNLIERALILGAFPRDLGGPPAERTAVSALAEVERRHILAVLEAAGGDRTEAARRLGISRKTIDRKCAAWDA